MYLGTLWLLLVSTVFAFTNDELIKLATNSSQMKNAGPSSHEQPTSIPIDWHLLSEAAGMSSQDYCSSQRVGETVGDAELLYQFGDGFFLQRALIFKSKKLGLTVAFEGTETSSIFSEIHDADFRLVNPSWLLDGAYPENVQVSDGFETAYLQVAKPILAKLREYMETYKETRVSVTGHSLGAAMALIAAGHYNHVLDQGIHYALVFGLPRTGDGKFANFIDETLKDKVYYVVNGHDVVPHVPPRGFGYQHPSGQIWINPADSTEWKFYPGQENVHGANSVGLALNTDDHLGTYFHTGIGESEGDNSCPAQVGNL
ncbi:hypothetical protein MBRA1_003466 [Malassezia brasiliensis]|uniref:Fungal lipase-type domain-containing protein n=1 Tax=Malassezia brasiliensis TaxID=1821822 RepID=A0AAF0DWI1_9BASI|nr:hypothetical protein MBRA1_003466 [Malassezia brasiliensis]